MGVNLLELLKEIADSGTPFQLDVIDDSAGTDRAYLDLVDTDDNDAPYRLILEGPEVHG